MKKLLFFLGLSFCLMGSAMAQSALYHKTKQLKESEVPVTIMKAFETNFQSTLDKTDGAWSVLYLEEPDLASNISRFVPISYSFESKKKGSDKIEITFAPNGELKKTHGLNGEASPSHSRE